MLPIQNPSQGFLELGSTIRPLPHQEKNNHETTIPEADISATLRRPKN
jgi:hypothetical protein